MAKEKSWEVKIDKYRCQACGGRNEKYKRLSQEIYICTNKKECFAYVDMAKVQSWHGKNTIHYHGESGESERQSDPVYAHAVPEPMAAGREAVLRMEGLRGGGLYKQEADHEFRDVDQDFQEGEAVSLGGG